MPLTLYNVAFIAPAQCLANKVHSVIELEMRNKWIWNYAKVLKFKIGNLTYIFLNIISQNVWTSFYIYIIVWTSFNFNFREICDLARCLMQSLKFPIFRQVQKYLWARKIISIVLKWIVSGPYQGWIRRLNQRQWKVMSCKKMVSLFEICIKSRAIRTTSLDTHNNLFIYYYKDDTTICCSFL